MKNFLLIFPAFFIFAITRLLILTCKVEIIKTQSVLDREKERKPIIFAFWHGRMFPTPFFKSKIDVYIVVSRHGDGEVMSRAVRFLGIKSIRGSTDRKSGEHKKGFPAKNRGGASVIREAIKVLEDGNSLSITPDGPKGPRFKFKRNSLMIAEQTKTPIAPLSFSANKVWIINSWDKFIIPKPFSKIKVKFCDLYFVNDLDSEDKIEAHAEFIEKTLNDITTELDNEFGVKL